MSATPPPSRELSARTRPGAASSASPSESTPADTGARPSSLGGRGPVLAVMGGILGLGVLVTLLAVLGVGGNPELNTRVASSSAAVFAWGAALSCGALAARSKGRARYSWASISVACLGWGVGQILWSVWGVGRGESGMFPTFADMSLLLLPLGATIGLGLHQVEGSREERERRVLDACTITAAVALLAWSAVLGPAAATGAAGDLRFVAALSYAGTDVLLVTLGLIVLSRTRAMRGALVFVVGGLAAIMAADGLAAYIASTGGVGISEIGAGSASLGWAVGFALLGLAPLASRAEARESRETDEVWPSSSKLPYVPVLLAAVLLGGEMWAGGVLDQVQITLGAMTAGFVLVRQYSTVAENSRLVGALGEREEKLRHQAFHDTLTGLANRALFSDRVTNALERHQRNMRSLAVLFLDLDDFKLINDTLGHGAGDDLLCQVSVRLRSSLRAGDTLARLGGDEFAILLEDDSDAVVVATHLVDLLSTPFLLEGQERQVHASIGLSRVTADQATPSATELLAQADTAMYSAKRGGKGAYAVFRDGMELSEITEEDTRERLARAISNKDITLAYQPILDVANGEVLGFEALARWSENGVSIPPDQFIATAERTGLIAELTAHVLESACQQIRDWKAAGAGTSFHVAINVSPQQVVDLEFPDQVAAALERHEIEAHQLVIEITESALLSNMDLAREVCGRLVDMGILLSLDDFGVGYSSITHLSEIPLHSIKIDRSFTKALDTSTGAAKLARAVLRFGSDMDMRVIAEGVERPEQLRQLRQLGCSHAQGYLLGRPSSPETWTVRLAKRNSTQVGGVPAPRSAIPGA